MEAAANVGPDMTSTIMYGHIENEHHRVEHLEKIRELQDQTSTITEFVPLSFVHQQTSLYERAMVDAGASDTEEKLMIAMSRLFLDNIDHIQSSWVKFGDEKALELLGCGADDFMGRTFPRRSRCGPVANMASSDLSTITSKWSNQSGGLRLSARLTTDIGVGSTLMRAHLLIPNSTLRLTGRRCSKTGGTDQHERWRPSSDSPMINQN